MGVKWEREKRASFFLFPSFFFTLSSCKRSTAPLADTKNLQLKVEDVSCTEAWLRLTNSPAYYGKSLKLLRDDSLIISKPLTANDTLPYDRGLLPLSFYTYRARVCDGERTFCKCLLLIK